MLGRARLSLQRGVLDQDLVRIAGAEIPVGVHDAVYQDDLAGLSACAAVVTRISLLPSAADPEPSRRWIQFLPITSGAYLTTRSANRDRLVVEGS